MGVNVIPIPGDLSSPTSPAKVTQSAAGALGGLYFLVTNSGGPPAGDLESFNDDTWVNSLNFISHSHVRSIRAALPHLRKSESTSVLTITFQFCKTTYPSLALSNSNRDATVGLTKTLALELGVDGIHFNSILAGWTKTERVYELMEHLAKIFGTTIEGEFFKTIKGESL